MNEDQIVIDSFMDKGLVTTHSYQLKGKVELNRFVEFSTYLYDIYIQILRNLNIDVLHIQHFMMVGHEISHAASTLGIPIMSSMHDYYTLCPSYNLLNNSNVYCGIPDNLEICDACISQKFNAPGAHMLQWRLQFQSALSLSTLIHYPSEFSRDLAFKAYPVLVNKASVILATSFETIESTEKTIESKISKICILGYYAVQKGAILIREIIPEIIRNGIVVYFIGSSEEQWSFDHDVLNNCRFLGSYDGRHGNVINILKEINPDVVLILSIWPETFMRTLTESWSAHVPAIVLDIGAQSERVREHGGGWIVPKGTLLEIKETILKMLMIEIPGNKVNFTKVCSDTELAIEYHRTYETIMRISPYIDTWDQIIDDITELIGAPRDEVVDSMQRELIHDGSSVANEWIKVNPKTDLEIMEFYQNTRAYLYDLAGVNAITERKKWNHLVHVFLMYNIGIGNIKLLDYGCGIGNDALFFANKNYDIVCFDVGGFNLKLAELRCRKLDLINVQFIGFPQLPRKNEFHAAICFEVLEHVSDPVSVLRNISDSLVIGAFAFITESFELIDAKYPSHLESNRVYIHRLNDIADAVGLSYVTTLANRVLIFKKREM
ncbi:methyltransferase domain-containing protein [Sulfoacidibacillus ferrooxidans]|uniref:methyltransferase domain-containing protein n=1 Tax=Sulfoacidibacillus ferrooxidans TaxID=2005001 RepID=UPI001F511351